MRGVQRWDFGARSRVLRWTRLSQRPTTAPSFTIIAVSRRGSPNYHDYCQLRLLFRDRMTLGRGRLYLASRKRIARTRSFSQGREIQTVDHYEIMPDHMERVPFNETPS